VPRRRDLEGRELKKFGKKNLRPSVWEKMKEE